MSETMKWRTCLSAALVIITGSLLHFAWEWSGRSTVVAVFAAINESTWEHLKLAFWPALVLAPFQYKVYGPFPGWLPATAVRCTLPSFLIVVLFYGYTTLLGRHHLVADLTIFVIAILAGEIVGHTLLTHRFGAKYRMSALGILVITTMLFATLTFTPPNYFLFQAPPAHADR